MLLEVQPECGESFEDGSCTHRHVSVGTGPKHLDVHLGFQVKVRIRGRQVGSLGTLGMFTSSKPEPKRT